MILPLILSKKTCIPPLFPTIFYPLVWTFLPSLILGTLVVAIYHGIHDLKDEIMDMEYEDIRTNESLKEYKFRARLLMGIVTVFIISGFLNALHLVSLQRHLAEGKSNIQFSVDTISQL